MSYETITVQPLTPCIGAEVSGVELASPLDSQTLGEIHDAWMTHQVLFFRDQSMDLDAHLAFGRAFGELHIHPGSPAPPGQPEVLIVHADATSKHIAGDEKWHSDVSCVAEPPMGSILHLNTVPGSGGDTLFASMYAAFEALSQPMQQFLESLTATHDGEHVFRGRYKDRGVDDTVTTYPSAVHPVVRTHPVTGRKALYVNSIFTTRINELTIAEGRVLLDYLLTHAARPEFTCRFRGQQGSVAFWDNRCAQHLAPWDYYPEVRSGYRVTIKGDRPV